MLPATTIRYLPPLDALAKVAEKLRSAVMETEQVVWVPLQAPDHPVNEFPRSGVAVSVTCVAALLG